MLPFRLTVATAHYRVPICFTRWVLNFRFFDRYWCRSHLASHLQLRRRDHANWTRALGPEIENHKSHGHPRSPELLILAQGSSTQQACRIRILPCNTKISLLSLTTCCVTVPGLWL